MLCKLMCLQCEWAISQIIMDFGHSISFQPLVVNLEVSWVTQLNAACNREQNNEE